MLIGNQLSVKIKHKTLLDNIDFYVKPNEIVVIIGPNGAGKSSLMKALSGDLPLSGGTVNINQRELNEYSLLELAKLRAVLTQSYELDFPFTVNEVVDMAHFSHQEQCTQATLKQFSNDAMKAVGITHLAQQCFTQLSGGEKQRTQLARVLCQLQPSLTQQKNAYLLIDEPTASLDLYHQYEVMNQAVTTAKQGAGVVAVLHDLSLAASFADRIYMLDKGKVVAHGSPEEVLTQRHLSNVYNINAKLQTDIEDVLPHIMVAEKTLTNI
ncbi:heme ABC transporter ATP-binding protein [Pseudoalteromonas sp. NZS127_1]|uniref:heme ABC transporter ATP-binding protein n=1 Tax=unclassified Pseudoalteromonas TaxID=194690 RepID=UPI00140E7B8B|nr:MULTISPECIES: heme ABC transporter ATP-binding protein [unclassified Pseudoalteromonas]MBG9995584.1 heme ABC transporter ATP-binding protein [Pseudoalteromonas sp. NZS127_1]MBH0028595.1 heme ABC transporter ATP-binding protein [Pseudoalteromonas sp. SWN29]MBH0041156.1 heme ABC transporter ATP-binding protein [Pseudoalteromonas sp. SWXJZ10B]MBH0075042.1 heme ABC transporter ATP-binding protein [Pseudoalteromonas sp. SWYJ118]